LENDGNGDPACRKVLLVLEIPIGGDKDIKPGLFGSGGGFPVGKKAPEGMRVNLVNAR
jgi:hypothetical protein